jgi:xanthine permease XanP
VPQKPSNLLYGVEDTPPVRRTVLLGLQHVFVMSVTLILPVLIVQAMGGTPAQAQHMVRMSLIAGGLGTLLQALHRGPVGSGYLCPQLSGPAYLSTSLLAAKTGGLSLVCGMTIIAGCFEALLSRVVYRLRALFPTEVTGLVVVMVGMALVPVGVSNFVGMARPDMVSETPKLLVGGLTLACMVGLTVWGKGPLRLYSVLIGMGIGYLAASVLGILPREQLDMVRQTVLVSVPAVGNIGWSFDTALLLPFLIAALASSLKAIGDLTTCQKINDADWQRPDIGSISRGLLADACGVLAAGVLGGMGQSTSSSNVGLSNATGATSRRIAYAAGGLAIALAFVPKLAIVLVIMPQPVIGATLIFVASFMLVAGIQIIMSRLLDARKTFIIGIAMIFGLSVDILPGLYANAPAWMQPLLSSSLSLATITALVLNLVFRIGMADRRRLTVAPGPGASETIFTVLEAQGAAWGARKDVVYRAIAALTELVETVTALGLTTEAISIEARFDEYNLDLDVRYDGTLLELPTARPSEAEMLSDDRALTQLAGFLMRHYTDRITSATTDGHCRVQLHFDH